MNYLCNSRAKSPKKTSQYARPQARRKPSGHPIPDFRVFQFRAPVSVIPSSPRNLPPVNVQNTPVSHIFPHFGAINVRNPCDSHIFSTDSPSVSFVVAIASLRASSLLMSGEYG